MIRYEQIFEEIEGLDAEALTRWIERGWVRPEGEGEARAFTDTDVARVRLIRECRVEMEIDADAMPVVLSLLDQLHGVRRELLALSDAVAGQTDDIRRDILEHAMKGIGGRRS
ncbi:MAG: hypothetical protein JJ900_04750 [Rhodospirillales bacterium]|nr:hypothetical protein [Rhodospirillales bacterium]MBO6786139.1 hypothetical protein [Rhodospirillales bacterium]